MITVWDLIVQGEYEKACLEADREAGDGNSSELRNKVLALLNLRRYQEVIELCDLLIQKNCAHSSESDYICKGVAQWLSNDRQNAVESWRAGKDTVYTDAAGGVQLYLLLMYAAYSLKDKSLEKEATKRLKVLCKRKSVGAWPGPIGAFMLGKMEERELRSLRSRQSKLRARETCQAAFHIGVVRRSLGDMKAFEACMREATSQDRVSLLEEEYYLALGELEQL